MTTSGGSPPPLLPRPDRGLEDEWDSHEAVPVHALESNPAREIRRVKDGSDVRCAGTGASGENDAHRPWNTGDFADSHESFPPERLPFAPCAFAQEGY